MVEGLGRCKLQYLASNYPGGISLGDAFFVNAPVVDDKNVRKWLGSSYLRDGFGSFDSAEGIDNP